MRALLISGAAFLGSVACAAETPAETPSAATEAASGVVTAMPEITIYHLEGRRSERVVWLMEELGLPYKLEYVRGDLGASMQKVRDLGHKMHMVPDRDLWR